MLNVRARAYIHSFSEYLYEFTSSHVYELCQLKILYDTTYNFLMAMDRTKSTLGQMQIYFIEVASFFRMDQKCRFHLVSLHRT